MCSMLRLFIIYKDWFKIGCWNLLLVKSWLIMAYCLLFPELLTKTVWLYAISNHWNIFRKISHKASSNCWSQCIKSHCNIFRVAVHSVTMLPKFSIETPYITFGYSLYIKPFEISKYLQMVFLIRLSGFQLLIDNWDSKSG